MLILRFLLSTLDDNDTLQICINFMALAASAMLLSHAKGCFARIEIKFFKNTALFYELFFWKIYFCSLYIFLFILAFSWYNTFRDYSSVSH